MELSKEVYRGQRVYNAFTLAIYDFLLFTLLTKLVWRCPKEALLALYNRHISDNHLDVGVGSGYLLDNCQFPSLTPRLALMDVNQSCLDFTDKRLRRYQPSTYRHNILAAVNEDEHGFKLTGFDSISINYVLHCLPGTITEKMIVFDNLYPLLNPGGVIFGCTIIADSKEKNWLGERLMSAYNRKGVFCNKHDSFEAFKRELTKRYQNVKLKQLGYVAQFVIKKVIVKQVND